MNTGSMGVQNNGTGRRENPPPVSLFALFFRLLRRIHAGEAHGSKILDQPDEQRPGAWAVEFAEEQRLPGAQDEVPVFEKDSLRGTHE
jgi:hypothetical protein